MPDIFIADKKPTSDNEKALKESHPSVSDEKKHHLKSAADKLIHHKSSPHPEKKIRIFSTFYPDPEGITFADQEPDEKILLFLRRHYITNVDWILLALFFTIIPIVFGVINSFNIFNFNIFVFLNFPANFTLLFLIFYYSVVFTFILVNFVSWFYNLGLLTTRRIVDIDLHDLTYKNVSTTGYGVVQDASYIQNGVIMSLFHFGDVHIQTAGQHGNFELESVPSPERVVHLIEDYIGKK